MTNQTNASTKHQGLTQPLSKNPETYAMTTLRKMILIGALLAAAPSIAEDAHHPAGTAQAMPPAASPTMPRPGTSPMPGGQPGMMDSGMMSGGMISPGMMSSMMSMMGPMGQMMAPEHVEGRIAFLKAELKITDAQQPLWNAFADALRANARGMHRMMTELHGAMMPSPTAAPTALPQRIEIHEHMLAARLDSLRQIKAALQPLYAALDDTQKQAADRLLMAGPMGLM
jgi:hypothetical protein